MSKKVYISPSDQVSNAYAWGNTNEHAQCQKIAEAEAEALRRSGKDLRWVEKKAAAQKLKIDDVYLMVACPDGSCDIVAKERGR